MPQNPIQKFQVAIDIPVKRNVIINGNFNIWQRATSVAAIASGTYVADRWRYEKTGTMVHTLSRSTDVPTFAQADVVFNFSLRLQTTVIDASIAAADFTTIETVIEGYDFAAIHQRPIIFSFWVKSSITGTYCCYFRNGALQDRSLVMEYTINMANTWERKEIILPPTPAANGIDNNTVPAAGTWQTQNQEGLDVGFTIAGGTNVQTTPGIWQTGNFFSTASQVNGVGALGDFHVTGIQLEVGTIATPFEIRPFEEELSLCQRYYEKSYTSGVDPGTAFGHYTTGNSLAGVGTIVWTYIGTSAFGGGPPVMTPFRVLKRSAPTLTVYSPASGVAGNITLKQTASGTSVDASVTDIASAALERGVITWNALNALGLVVSDFFEISWTADAEF